MFTTAGMRVLTYLAPLTRASMSPVKEVSKSIFDSFFFLFLAPVYGDCFCIWMRKLNIERKNVVL